ncbi:hypothetical protein FACS189487_01910 [Campylobacterota bacterium]|nr:hypothetical protein FACS189487_01910 [Campylobacterota bacterium]
MRDQLRDKAYYDKYIAMTKSFIEEDLQELDSYKDEGKASCVFSLVQYTHGVIVMRYSRGDTIESMRESVQKSYEILQLRRKVLNSVKIGERTMQMWENLSLGELYHYLTLLSFMVSLHFPAEDILNVLELVDHKDEDALLELVAAYFGKKEANAVQVSKYPKVHGKLVALIQAPPSEQPKLLKKYVERWYQLNKPIPWYDFHKGAEGAYEGYWCFEVALVVMLLGIDDQAVTAHPHYPADLVSHYRQQTHPQ